MVSLETKHTTDPFHLLEDIIQCVEEERESKQPPPADLEERDSVGLQLGLGLGLGFTGASANTLDRPGPEQDEEEKMATAASVSIALSEARRFLVSPVTSHHWPLGNAHQSVELGLVCVSVSSAARGRLPGPCVRRCGQSNNGAQRQ